MYLICIIRYFMDILLCLFLMVSLGQEACELNHDSHGDGTVWAADLVVFLGEYGLSCPGIFGFNCGDTLWHQGHEYGPSRD
mgnify:CR=1 FL=1